MQARALRAAALSATAEDQLAISLDQLAGTGPHRYARLHALSQAATRRATRMRQWAHDHAGTG